MPRRGSRVNLTTPPQRSQCLPSFASVNAAILLGFIAGEFPTAPVGPDCCAMALTSPEPHKDPTLMEGFDLQLLHNEGRGIVEQIVGCGPECHGVVGLAIETTQWQRQQWGVTRDRTSPVALILCCHLTVESFSAVSSWRRWHAVTVGCRFGNTASNGAC